MRSDEKRDVNLALLLFANSGLADRRVNVPRSACHGAPNLRREDYEMKWETPAYCDLRLGFEVTAYVYVR